MKQKLFCVVVIVSLFLCGSLAGALPIKTQGYAEGEVGEISSNGSEEFLDFCSAEKNATVVSTWGPVGSWFTIADIHLIDGDPFKVLLIELMLQSIPYFIRPYVPLSLENVTFSIKYTRNIPDLPLLNRFSYETGINEDGEITLFTEKHTLIVTGFSGTFGYYHKKPILLYPAYFSFIGTCDEVLVLS